MKHYNYKKNLLIILFSMYSLYAFPLIIYGIIRLESSKKENVIPNKKKGKNLTHTLKPTYKSKKIQKGFIFYSQFITSYEKSLGISESKIWISNSIYKTFIKILDLPDQSLSIWTPKNSSNLNFLETYNAYIGDSKKIHIGDNVYIRGIKTKILFERKICTKNYLFPCFITDIPFNKKFKNQPVIDNFGKIVGFNIIIKRKNINHSIIIPINDIKSILLKNLNLSNILKIKEKLLLEKANTSFLRDGIVNNENKFKIYNKIKSTPDFYKIIDFKVDSRLNLYVLDSKQFQKLSLSYNLKDNTYQFNHESTPPYTDLENPISFTIGKNSFIYILDEGKKCILVLNSNLKFVQEISYHNVNLTFFPKKIFYYKNNLIIISKYNEIFFLNKIQNFKKSLYQFYKNKNFKNEFLDITIKEDILYSLTKTYKNNFFVQRIYSNEKIKNQFEIKKFLLKNPSQIYMIKKKFYIVDLKNEEYIILNQKGLLLKKGVFRNKYKIQKASSYFILNENIHLVSYNYPDEIKLFNLKNKETKTNFLSISNLEPIYKENSEIQNIFGCPSFFLKETILYYLCHGEKISSNLVNKNYSFSITNDTNEKVSKNIKPKKYNLDVRQNQVIRFIGHFKDKSIEIDILNHEIILKKNNKTTYTIPFNNLGKNTIIEKGEILEGEIFLLDKANSKIVHLDFDGIIKKYFFIQDHKKNIIKTRDFTLTSNKDFLFLSKWKIFIYDKNGYIKKSFLIERDRKKTQSIIHPSKISYLNESIYLINNHHPYIFRYKEKNGVFKKEEILIEIPHVIPINIKAKDNKLFILDQNYQTILYTPKD